MTHSQKLYYTNSTTLLPTPTGAGSHGLTEILHEFSSAAACELIEKVGGRVVGITFLIELCELAGRDKLGGYRISTLAG